VADVVNPRPFSSRRRLGPRLAVDALTAPADDAAAGVGELVVETPEVEV
jgi:hypothetical protein